MAAKSLTQEQVLVFDLDDTLYLEADFVLSGFRAVDVWCAAEHGIQGFFDKAWAQFESGARGKIFDLALAGLGVDDGQTLVPDMVKVYREHRPTIACRPDALRMLEQAGSYRGFAMITDGYHLTQLRKVEALGVARYCTPVIRTDVWGRDFWKPHARSYETVQAHYGLPPEAFTYIGDNPKKDFVSPKALGWHTVRIRREGGLHADLDAAPELEAMETIESLDQLLP
jgi:putative hydrolase of the HAD superfamily